MSGGNTLVGGTDVALSEVDALEARTIVPATRHGAVASGSGRRAGVLILSAGVLYGVIALAAYWPGQEIPTSSQAPAPTPDRRHGSSGGRRGR